MLHFIVFFFFSSRRRHTRSLCDWSSDVCSSDLGEIRTPGGGLIKAAPPIVKGGPRTPPKVPKAAPAGPRRTAPPKAQTAPAGAAKLTAPPPRQTQMQRPPTPAPAGKTGPPGEPPPPWTR